MPLGITLAILTAATIGVQINPYAAMVYTIVMMVGAVTDWTEFMQLTFVWYALVLLVNILRKAR